MKDFGSYLKQLRELNKLTLREVEEIAGVSNAYVSQLERNLKTFPHPEILKKLAKLYNVSCERMFIEIGYLEDKEDKSEKIQLPDCPYCEENDWRFMQFGLTTNYFQCNNCFHTSPPKKTRVEAIEIMMALEKEREYHINCDQ